MTEDAKITELQTSIAYLETTVDDLNTVIAQQDKQLLDMQRQIKLLYQHTHQTNSNDGIAPFDINADRPPHY